MSYLSSFLSLSAAYQFPFLGNALFYEVKNNLSIQNDRVNYVHNKHCPSHLSVTLLAQQNTMHNHKLTIK